MYPGINGAFREDWDSQLREQIFWLKFCVLLACPGPGVSGKLGRECQLLLLLLLCGQSFPRAMSRFQEMHMKFGTAQKAAAHHSNFLLSSPGRLISGAWPRLGLPGPRSPRLKIKREPEGRACFSYSLTPVAGVPECSPVSCDIWASLGYQMYKQFCKNKASETSVNKKIVVYLLPVQSDNLLTHRQKLTQLFSSAQL